MAGLGLMLWSGNGMMDASDSSVVLCRSGSSVSIHCKCTQNIPKSWNKTLAQNFSNLQFVSIASIISVNTITAINKDQMNMRWEENGFVCKRTSRTCSRLQMSSNQTGLAMFTLISKAIQAWPVGYSYAGGNFAHAFGLFLGCCWLWYKQVCCKTLAARHSFPFTKLCLNEASKSRVDWDLERPDTNTEDHSRMNLSVSVCPGRVRHVISIHLHRNWPVNLGDQEAIFHHYPPLNLLRNKAGVLAVSLGFHLMCKTEWTTCIALRFCSASEPLSIILYFAPV